MAETYERMLRQGSTNQLELDKAHLHQTTVDGRLSAIRLEQSQLLAELQAMNGGRPIVLSDTIFILSPLPTSFEDYLNETEQHSPLLRYMQQQRAVADDHINVARASSFPKWSVGYMGEFVTGNTFQGVTVSLSIPLWENKNRVRQARQAAIAISQQADDARLQYRTHMRSLYDQAVQLQQTVAQYDAALSHDGLALLTRAFEKGELPLLNYLLEQDYWTNAYDHRLQALRDLALVVAELNAWKL